MGIGGWVFEPWRDNFYPRGLPQHRELEYASGKLSVIEINSTYYRAQAPATFAKWREQTPADFVFSVKASRYATNRGVLADAGEAIDRFVNGGIAELGPKLGPIVWEFAATKRFDADDFAAFVKLLPAKVGGLQLRHALDVRHQSFKCAAYLRIARRRQIATVFTDADDCASFADITGGFVYARIKRTDARWARGFRPLALDQIAERARMWRDGGEPADVPRVEPTAMAALQKLREVFILFVSGAKEKAPAAAMALRNRVEHDSTERG